MRVAAAAACVPAARGEQLRRSGCPPWGCNATTHAGRVTLPTANCDPTPQLPQRSSAIPRPRAGVPGACADARRHPPAAPHATANPPPQPGERGPRPQGPGRGGGGGDDRAPPAAGLVKAEERAEKGAPAGAGLIQILFNLLLRGVVWLCFLVQRPAAVALQAGRVPPNLPAPLLPHKPATSPRK